MYLNGSTGVREQNGLKMLFLLELDSILCSYPDGVKGSEGLAADPEVENAGKNKQQAGGCCRSWERNGKVF